MLNKSVVLLEKRHFKQDFDCEIPELNQFLQQQAGQKSKRNHAKTYVLLADDDLTIVGYFTLTTTQFKWNETVGKSHQMVNTAGLIARLAVDKRFKGKKVGSYLLRTALLKLVQANEIMGIPVIVVDAKDGAKAFYEQFGFQTLDNNRLFLLMETLLKSF